MRPCAIVEEMSEGEQFRPIGRSFEQTARNIAIQGASIDDALAIVSQYYPAGSKMSGKLLSVILARGKGLSERQRALDALQARYVVELKPVTLNLFIQTTSNLDDAKAALEWGKDKLGVKPDEGTMTQLVTRASGLKEAKEAIAYFQEKFGPVELSPATLNTLINCLPALKDSKKTVSELADELNVTPNVATFKAALYKTLTVSRPTADTVKDARDMIDELNKLGFDVEKEAATQHMDFQIRFARYLFMTQRPADAVQLLSPLLQSSGEIDVMTKRIVLPMIFSFLPENHPVRAAVEQSLRHRGLQDVLVAAIARAQKFDTIFAEWAEHEQKRNKFKYGGGTVFDDLHGQPINRQALREVL